MKTCEHLKEVGCIKDICSCSTGPKCKDSFENTIDIISVANSMFDMTKQETFEEAKKYAELSYYGDEVNAFVNGVKWQEKRMYNEEEVKDMMFEVLNQKREECCVTHTKDSIVRKVFEQFKKEKL